MRAVAIRHRMSRPAPLPVAFDAVGLPADLLLATERMGFSEMTPIQSAALPPILAGRDVRGLAKTGSGKTAAFGLGLLYRVPPRQRPGPPTALVLGPTRELVEQVAASLRQLAQTRANTRVLTLCGGRPLRPQRNALQQGVHIVVGTPGRVADHMRRGNLDVSALTMVVLDEADRMLDMGFTEEVSGILDRCPEARQTLLFSATFPKTIDTLSASIQRDPITVTVDTTVSREALRQEVVYCERNRRYETVAAVLAWHDPDAALVFCETRQQCDGLQQFLTRCGASVLTLHGGLEQRERDDVLVQFANGSARFLVATDVAARGLDIPALPLVVQAELARDPQVHVHRIGRTARAGAEGLAVALVASEREADRLALIETELERSIPVTTPPVDAPPRFRPSRYRTLLILAGRKHKVRKGDVLGALVKDGGIPPKAIGDIRLAQTTCAVALERAHAVKALRFLRRGRIKKVRVRATLLGSDRAG